MAVTNEALAAYGSVKIESAGYGDPHQLISMLMEGAISRLVNAKIALREKRYADRGRNIQQAVSIINGLRDCLDLDRGGELADRLNALYIYMVSNLLGALMDKDDVKVEEVRGLMAEIYGGWAEIPVDVRSTFKR
ncbi:MAG: flagellar export chaperone FliS [Gammaproteobacteria bacterium]|nr:flagellar export chaperone FliS [Gammaproteobacteria bacterium]